MRSDDRGKTWSIEQSPVDDVAISGIAVAGRDAAWVTVGSGEVYFTADGGASWQKQGQELAASFIEPRFVGVATAGRSVVAVGRDQLGTIGATVNFPPMIARSTDGGATWSPAVLLSGAHSVAPLYDACLLDSGVGLAVSNGFDGQVVFTTGDDGATWGLSYEGATALRYACGGGSDLWLVDFEFGDGVTVTKPLRSRDAGQTWEDVSEHIPGTLSSGAESPDLSVGAIVFADAMRGWLFGSLVVARDPETRQPTATQPTALETFDGGDTWRKADLPLPEADVYVALASRRHVVALGRSGGLLFSDGEWEQFSLPAEVMVVFPEATAITD